MIELTKLKGAKFALNSDHIETIEETPDTVITLLNGHKYVVCERTKEIVSMIETFRRNSSGSPAPGYISAAGNE
ncbi:MAG: flagellar FlbD family protein [Synergistaceae bacterium]|jgi:flagellar protein FlbD|nr:flagellar FlbD family protein [Synergistaceae bacterium]